MIDRDDNPFLRFGLDPAASLAELTRVLRERMEDASPDERAELRAAWESLARSPARRFELVLEAGPTPERLPPQIELPAIPSDFEPTLADLLAPPPIAPTLPIETEAERALRRIDLGFLVVDDEISVTGSIPTRRYE